MQRYRPALVAASIFLAIFLPMLTALKAHQDMASYPIVKIEIEPYDPRDLMYGHYMQFAFKWNWKGGSAVKEDCTSRDCCLCANTQDNPEVSLMTCPPAGQDTPSCKYILKGRYFGGDRFDIGINRYYVDEKIALPLEKLFVDRKEKFFLGLGTAPNGKTIIEKLYIGDQSLSDYLASHDGRVPQETPKNP